jgi:beta-mannosidase
MRLHEHWKLADFAPGQGLSLAVHAPQYDDSDWLPAAVPGDVHTSLVRAGRIQPPFYNMNIETCQWVEEREWWYRTTFRLPQGKRGDAVRYLLRFDGLDTFATVYLNGIEVGCHANMFIAAEFDVSERLRFDAANTLALRFDPVVATTGDRPWIDDEWKPRNPIRVWVRKAQYNFGWDWAPRLVSVGIWRDVTLRRYQGALLNSVFFKTLEITPQAARVAVQVEVERWSELPALTVHIRLERDGQSVAGTVSPSEGGTGEIELELPDPALWWTYDLGEPALYDLAVELCVGDQVLDTRREQVGVRTIEVDQSPDPDEPGTKFFTFVLNGVKTFAKGANWIPADSFVSQVDEDRYRELLGLAVAANMNMLRVWGGGIYEKDAFYRLCDELGLLVWQDFMFACAPYPDHDPEFTAEVAREAEAVLRRLRNHPCIALWCGNNENDWLADQAHWQQPGHQFPGWRINRGLLPPIVERLDGTRAYWPSSPYGGNDHNDEREGDRHNWQVWHGSVLPRRFGQRPEHDSTPEGVSFRHYAKDMARFVSEFGMHAAPVLETLRRNVPATGLRLGSPELLYRNKDDPKDKGNHLMASCTSRPTTLDQYIDFSMIAQAEGLKFGIEHYRRRKFHCSGTLFWQLNDCWPGLSWSVLDYYRFPKAGYFYVRRAYAPVIASFRAEADGSVSLWLVNDTLAAVTDRVVWGHGIFDGRKLHEEELEISVPANSVSRVVRIPGSVLDSGDPARRYLHVRSARGLFPDNRHFFVSIKDLKRPPADLRVEKAATDDGIDVRVTSDLYAYFVKLTVPTEGTRFSDNYFDLFPEQVKVVQVWNARGQRLAPDDIAVSSLATIG